MKFDLIKDFDNIYHYQNFLILNLIPTSEKNIFDGGIHMANEEKLILDTYQI